MGKYAEYSHEMVTKRVETEILSETDQNNGPHSSPIRHAIPSPTPSSTPSLGQQPIQSPTPSLGLQPIQSPDISPISNPNPIHTHGENSTKRGNANLELSDFGKLSHHLEKRVKNNVSNSFKELLQQHKCIQQGELIKSNDLKGKLTALQQEHDEQKKTFREEKEKMEQKIIELEGKIAELQKEKNTKTCITCAKVIDSLIYCNSDCLK